MAKRGVSIFMSLTLIFVVIFVMLTVLRGILVWLFPVETLNLQHGPGFWRNAYIIFLELTDPGNMAQDIYSSPWYKLLGIVAGLSGVVMLSALIASISKT